MWRFRVVFFLFCLLFLIISARLFYWQIVRADELTTLGQKQYNQSIKLIPARGEIKTSDGYAIATKKLSYLAFANPKEIIDRKKTVDALSEVLKIGKATASADLAKDLFWVPLKSGIDDSIKTRLDTMSLAGIGFEQQSVRFYPEASIAAQLIGFVGKNDLGENKGYFGLEGYYDRELSGKSGVAVVIHDALGRPILAKLNQNSGQTDGRSLTLSIDRAVQFLLDQKLKDGVEKYGAKGGMAAIMNPKTGEIIAMSSYPNFDPSHYQDFSSSFYKNPFISNAYEPGSTFKSLIMSAGIDSNVVKPDTKCNNCQGPVRIGEYDIRTWNDQYHPNLTMTDVIKYSDNTGMVFVSQKLGLSKMLSYLKKFGIGDMTGIDLQGEVAPEIKAQNDWYPIDVATASFGQGISVTPIELLTAFSSIANGGKRMEPHVVSAIETPDGQKIAISQRVLDQPISQDTAKIMTTILINAVENGEAKFAKPKGYKIAGKTGTAQIPLAGHYDPNKTVASFIGFAPPKDPKFSMLIVIDEPTSSIYGAETAAPLFFDIAKDLFTYYKIPPDE